MDRERRGGRDIYGCRPLDGPEGAPAARGHRAHGGRRPEGRMAAAGRARAEVLTGMSDRALAVALGAGTCIVYLAAGFGLLTDYDYYGRLAQSLVHLQWWLDEAPPWLNELLPCGDGRWCVAYPPLPAVLTAPFALVLPTALAQVL